MDAHTYDQVLLARNKHTGVLDPESWVTSLERSAAIGP